MVALKENQPTLYAEMKELFEKSRTHYPDRFRTHETVEKNHGRFERRTCVQTDFVEWFEELDEWYGLRSVVMVEEERIVGGVSSVERRFYISSLGVDPKEALRIVRAHWGIENKLHWTLDVVFREDACRARTGHAAENLAIMRHIAHQVLGRVKKAHHCGYVVAQNIPFGEAEPEGRPSVGVRHVVGRGAREGGLRQGGRLTKARGRSPRRGGTRARIVEKSPESQDSCRLTSRDHPEVVAMVKNGGTGEHC